MTVSLLIPFGKTYITGYFQSLNISLNLRKKMYFCMFTKNALHDLAINTALILGKFFIHKNRVLKTQPNFFVFHKGLCHYVLSLKLMETNAMKLYNLAEELNLAENL